MSGNLPKAASTDPCQICANLQQEEYAFQKYGWPDGDTYLPSAAGQLIIVRDFQPYDSRKLQLRQCLICGAHYLYRADYEYLVNGSEDEEYLTRLTDQEATEYLARAQPE